jgi:ubiquinone/menaquinone biosynthesis C-methylase UbiE
VGREIPTGDRGLSTLIGGGSRPYNLCMRRDTAAHSRAVTQEYDRLAPEYERRWRFYVEATADETQRRLAVRAGDHVLEIACGTGRLLDKIRAQQPGAYLTGVDLSFQMLRIARRRGSQLRLVEADAVSLPFNDQTFDVVVCSNSFHFLPDPKAALAEMRRVLKPGATLLLTDWCDDYVWCRLCDWYLRLTDPAHVRMYGSRQCRRLLGENGFRVERLDRYRVSRLWGLMTVIARPIPDPAIPREPGTSA